MLTYLLYYIVLFQYYIVSYYIMNYASFLTTLLLLNAEFSSLPFNNLSHPISSFLSSSPPLFNILTFLSLRYEFGLVSHSFVAAVKVLLREFDILVAQLEHLLSSNRLSLQKMVREMLLCGFDI